jgi:hypothetical protein
MDFYLAIAAGALPGFRREPQAGDGGRDTWT